MDTKHSLPEPTSPVHSQSITTLLHEFGSDQSTGLSRQVVLERQRQVGPNAVTEDTGNHWFKILLRQFSSPLIFILMMAVVATLLLEEWIDAAIVTLAIVVNAALGYYQEQRAENAIAHLRSFITLRTRVVRDGREQEIDAAELVPGDIVHITMGSRVPADGRIIEATGLRVDEAILTGESLPEEKFSGELAQQVPLADRTNCVYGGTLVTQGNALVLVTATGMQTEFGKIANLVGTTEREATPLQKAVHKLAWIITIGVAGLVAWIFVLGISRGEAIGEMFVVSIAVAVGAIPEALPIGLTAILAVGVERLARRKGIMRNLTAAETLGSTTVVMTDKTGTLTKALLQLVDVLTIAHLQSRVNRSAEHSPEHRFSVAQRSLLTLGLAGTDVVIENPHEAPDHWRLIGNPLETALVRTAATHHVDVVAVLEYMRRTVTVGFTSVHKFSVSRVQVPPVLDGWLSEQSQVQVVVGAPDILLARSALQKDEYLAFSEELTKHSEAGKRMIGIAVAPTDLPVDVDPASVQGLQFLGVLAFFDPVRPEVPAAIQKIENYGVRVVMATGDLPGTARAVARDLGWDVSEADIITGDALRQLDDTTLAQRLHTVKVCARVTPEDKLRIAQAFQARGDVVAMTGDGVNDAPSLKAVNIGIAVGSGSDVAKGVADLILLDDNFETIVAAIEEGKRVLGNIRKTFVYLMSNSLDEVILIGGSLLAGLALPLTAVQIIWVNFFTGSLPAVAFAFDRALDRSERPERGKESILNAQVKSLVVIIGVLTSLLLFAMYYTLLQLGLPEEEVRTFIFMSFSAYILFVAFLFRNLNRSIFSYNPFSNTVLNIGVVVGLILLMATVYVPWLQGIFSTVSLGIGWLFGVVLWVLITGVMVECMKWYHYR